MSLSCLIPSALRQMCLLDNSETFFGRLEERIYDNLIYNDRWLSILKGMGVTVEVTLIAIVIGTLLGLVLALCKLSTGGLMAVPRAISKAYITAIRGTPMMLQLLIIYFGVFASVSGSKVLIAGIAFGLNSAAYVAEIIRGGILSVDGGQTEAGRSLGMNSTQTFTRIILPQALKNALPTYCSEFIVLIKETAICGYIALTDLTRAVDVIRSRTFDPWIPLLAAALLYLLMTGILSKLFGLLERRMRQSDQR